MLTVSKCSCYMIMKCRGVIVACVLEGGVRRMDNLKKVKDIWIKYNFILTPSQKRWGAVVVIFTVIGAVLETIGVTIILPLVQVMINPMQLRENVIVASIIYYLEIDSDDQLIWLVGSAVVVVYFVKNGFLLLLSYVRIKYACKVQRELSVEMMESYLKRGYVFFLNTNTGDLLRGMRDSITNCYEALYQVFKLLAEVLTIVAICVYIMCSDIFMALCVMILAIICLLIVMLFFQNKVRVYGNINYKYAALINKVLLQTFQGIREVLVMQREKYFVNQYKDKYVKRQKGLVGQTVAAESPTYMIEAVCVIGLIIAVCFRATDRESALEFIPQLATFAMAAFRILPSLGRISNNFNQFLFCVPGINDTYNNFRNVRREEENPCIVREKEHYIEKFNNSISIENVVWCYPNVEHNVLDGISLDILKGQSIAFVGKSGAGKTTLADVVLGLLQPQSGAVKIDGININDISKGKSEIMGFVPQNVNLLDDTVRRNVAFGIADEEIDDAKVWAALEQAQLKETIENTDKGLDTEIGERGIRFSGGQRQRFAIARALYGNPGILVLDEATSALDTETETAVMEAINALHGHKTLIIIAHRLTTIKKCDKIYEIVDGKAVEREYQDLV